MLKENLPIRRNESDEEFAYMCAKHGAVCLAYFLLREGDDAFTGMLLDKFFHQEDITEFFKDKEKQ